MAVYKIFPTQDATIYSISPTRNTGIDEIIEATIQPEGDFLTSTSPEASRFLIQFSQEELLRVYTDVASQSPFSASLRCYAANVTNISKQTIVDVLAVSKQWNNGTGKYGDIPATTNGVSWLYALSEGSGAWETGSFSANQTASFNTANPGGGNWFTNAIYNTTQSFEYSNPVDLNVDTTATTNAWIQNIIPNNGFLVKQREEFNSGSNYDQVLKFFSIDTNTIYPPHLDFKWRDYIYNTGSNTNPTINQDNIYISLQDNPGTFRQGSINTFRLNVRPKYPTRVFQIAPLYTNNFYLPTGSYYAVQDVDTNEYIIDFDDTFTQISADDQTSYFTLYMNGLEPERYYKILIKTVVKENTYIFDENYYFKIAK